MRRGEFSHIDDLDLYQKGLSLGDRFFPIDCPEKKSPNFQENLSYVDKVSSEIGFGCQSGADR
jgi:hypothetical protein